MPQEAPDLPVQGHLDLYDLSRQVIKDYLLAARKYPLRLWNFMQGAHLCDSTGKDYVADAWCKV